MVTAGEIILVEEKEKLMRELGKKQLVLTLQQPLAQLPAQLQEYHLELSDDQSELTYTYDTNRESTGITTLLGDLRDADILFSDLYTTQSSLEDIFVDLVKHSR